MEQLLHYVWKHKLFPLHTLVTTQGEPLEIIDPGLPNPDAGPDFFNAKIKINGVLWVGNVEIHLRASDWLKHHHEQDTTYDSVILHVASDIDTQIQRTNGEPIPQLELHYPPYMLENYQELLATSRYPACYRLIPTLSPLLVHSWMNTLQLERFEQKTAQLLQRLEACNRNWEDAFFIHPFTGRRQTSRQPVPDRGHLLRTSRTDTGTTRRQLHRIVAKGIRLSAT